MNKKRDDRRSHKYITKTVDSSHYVDPKTEEWTDSDQKIIEKAMYDINRQLQAAGDIIMGINPSYGRCVEIDFGVGEDIKKHYLIAVRVDEDCPRNVKAALSQLVAIIHNERSSTAQAQGENQ